MKNHKKLTFRQQAYASLKKLLDTCELKRIEVKYGNIMLGPHNFYSGHKILEFHFEEYRYIPPEEKAKAIFQGVPIVIELYEQFEEPKKHPKKDFEFRKLCFLNHNAELAREAWAGENVFSFASEGAEAVLVARARKEALYSKKTASIDIARGLFNTYKRVKGDSGCARPL